MTEAALLAFYSTTKKRGQRHFHATLFGFKPLNSFEGNV
jgi:hypothetical protein